MTAVYHHITAREWVCYLQCKSIRPTLSSSRTGTGRPGKLHIETPEPIRRLVSRTTAPTWTSKDMKTLLWSRKHSEGVVVFVQGAERHMHAHVWVIICFWGCFTTVASKHYSMITEQSDQIHWINNKHLSDHLVSFFPLGQLLLFHFQFSFIYTATNHNNSCLRCFIS